MKSLEQLADELLGWPYDANFTCWDLVQYLFEHGRGLHLDALPELNRHRVQEVWFRGDPRPLADVVQPWDVLVCTVRGPLADHAGVVIDALWFIHNRENVGVCKEPFKRWEKRVLQVIRVQAQELPPSGTS
jgi:cell wall-associated NlpC family hydrolase